MAPALIISACVGVISHNSTSMPTTFHSVSTFLLCSIRVFAYHFLGIAGNLGSSHKEKLANALFECKRILCTIFSVYLATYQ